jgi:DNA-binding XRE family transcriptional regulator
VLDSPRPTRVITCIHAVRFAHGDDATESKRHTIIAIEQGRYSLSLEMAFQLARAFEVLLDECSSAPVKGRHESARRRVGGSPQRLPIDIRKSEMTTRTADASPVLIARITGILFIVMTVGAVFADFGVRRVLVDPGDASATAAKILASEQLFRFGLVGYLFAFVSDVPVAVLLYVLLRSVSKPLALTAASFRLVYAAVVGANLLSYVAALYFLSGTGYLKVFETAQLHALALLSLNIFNHGFSLALVFFGFHLLLLGVLLFKSTYFPKTIGVLIAVAGLAYLADNVSHLLLPAFNARVAPFLVLPECFEIVLALWLLVKGVREKPATN